MTEYTARIIEGEQPITVYELSTIESVEDMNGNIVRIKKNIGSFNLTELTSEKEMYERRIVKFNAEIQAIQNKIDSINSIK